MTTTTHQITANLHAPASYTSADVEAAVLYGLHVRSLHESVSARSLNSEGAFSVRIAYSGAAGAAEVRDVAARLSRIPHLAADAVRIDGRPVA